MDKEKDTCITVGKTIKEYTALKNCVIGESVKEIFQAQLINNLGACIATDTYFHKLLSTEILMENTSKSLRIFCGKDAALFLEALGDTFLNCCERIKINNGIVRISAQTATAEEMAKTLADLKQLAAKIRDKYQGINLKGFVFVEQGEAAHFIACDSEMIRIEDPHKPLEANSPASNIMARVYFNPGIAKDWEDLFDESFTMPKC